MAIAFLATIAAQMGSAWINSSRNKAHSKKMAELQRAYEEKAAIESIENARAEFAELCSFQREMEKQTHLDRLELIRKNHEQILHQIAYEKSLRKWPLLVPPYVIVNAPLTLDESTPQSIPLNCILITSADLSFNKKVFPKLEEQIALFCSKYWNISANKSVRFFQEAWRDYTKDIGPLHNDIYAHLKNVPTLLISPVLKNDTILFCLYWWGLSQDPYDAHVDELNELNPELSISITPEMKYDEEIIKLIVSECAPKLEAFISFFADMYYWNFYKISPSLPYLLEKICITLPDADKKEYRFQYTQQLIEFSSDDALSSNNPDEFAEFILSVSHIADAKDLNDCIIKYINIKRSSGLLNSFFLNSLYSLKKVKNLSIEAKSEINSTISFIQQNEEIGYFPCVGRNDLLQTLLNQKYYIPTATNVIISPINNYCSIIHFLKSNCEIAVGPMGYRIYFATHPEFSIPDEKEFSLTTYKLSSTKRDIRPKDELRLSEEDIYACLHSQMQFVNDLAISFDRLKDELWDTEMSLIDISYETLPSIINQINTESANADTCLLVIGYSKQWDNYTLCISILKDKQYVGDRFVCRSNSLDKTIRNKLNNKTILKIQLK